MTDRRPDGTYLPKKRPDCKMCGKPVRDMKNVYCSHACRGKDPKFQKGVSTYPGMYHRVMRLNPDPQPCVECGAPGKHRHHRDYSKPLEIVWMCVRCHRREHRFGNLLRANFGSVSIPPANKQPSEQQS